MIRAALLSFFAALLLAAPAHAQWKWRDASGKLQYSDLPPPAGTPDKEILQRPAPPARLTVSVVPPASAASAAAQRPAAPASQADVDAARQKREQEQEVARIREKAKQDEARVAEQRRDNCQRAQAGLRNLQSGTRLTRTNEKGERVFMDEAQVAAETQRARQVIASECR